MHQFRDKSQAQRELVSAGLLIYPVLQAADVLAYRADEVPVGEDQREHLELMRDIARRFNCPFGDDLLVVPEHRIPAVGARIMDLQAPDRKMSTTGGSAQGTVYVLDEPAAIAKKFRSSVTDSGSEVRRAPDKRGDLQPDRDPGRRARRGPGDDRGRVLRIRLRGLQAGGCRRGRRLPHPGPRALPGAAC